MSKAKHPLIKAALIALVSVVTILSFQSTVSAVSNVAPDPADNPGTSPGDVKLLVSAKGPGNGLDAPESEVVAYLASPSGTIRINNGADQCSKPPDTSTAAPTRFSFYEGRTPTSSPIPGRIGVSSDTYGCGSYDLNFSGINAVDIAGTTFYPIFIRAAHTGTPTGGVNAFTIGIAAGGGYMSYFGGGSNQFAIQDRNGDANDSSDFLLKFGTDCSINDNVTRSLQWFDDDSGNLELTTVNFGATLREIDPRTGASRIVLDKNDFAYKGNDRPGSRSYTFKPGMQYEWRWYGVKKTNGIQFSLPFDGLYSKVRCDWKLQPYSVVNKTTAKPGESVTFNHKVVNSGPAAAEDFKYMTWETRNGVNTNRWPNCSGDPYTGGADTGSGCDTTGNRFLRIGDDPGTQLDNYAGNQNTLTIPAGTPNGTKYCQFIRAVPYSKPMVTSAPGLNSVEACVTVGAEAPDACSDIPGIQTTIPAGRVRGPGNTCPPPPAGGCTEPAIGTIYLDRSQGPNTANSAPPTVNDTNYTQRTYFYDRTYVFGVTSNYGSGTLSLGFSYAEDDGTVEAYYAYLNAYPYDRHDPVAYYGVVYKQVITTWSRPDTSSSWTATNAYGADGVEYRSTAGPVKDKCYDRNFEILDPEATDVLSVNMNTDEATNTSNVEINVNTQARFSLSHGQNVLRPFSLSYNALNFERRFYVQHPDGSTDSLNGIIPNDYSFTASQLSQGNTPQALHTFRNSSPLTNIGVGDKICASFTITPKFGQTDYNGNIVPGSTSDSVESGDNPIMCSAPLTNKPYVRFYGNDVSAGGCYVLKAPAPAVCSGSTNNGIKAFSTGGTGAQTKGSAVQFGALSIGEILGTGGSGFGSASQRTGDPIGVKGLTFANRSTGTFGGGYSNTPDLHRIPDYFDTVPASPVPYSGGAFSGSTDAAYYANGDVTIPAATIQDGARITIYVDGNVTLDGNIRYQNDAWSSPENVPSFYIIAKGNIFIANSVGRLDGAYIAGGDGSSGVIDTCASASGSYPAAQLYDNCNSQLVVNGAFVANTVRLSRTFGTLRFSTPAAGQVEGPYSAVLRPCDLRNGSLTDINQDCSAEIFNTTPELYMQKPNMSVRGANLKFDSITSLSPVL